MHYAPITPPRFTRARLRPDIPFQLAERRQRNLTRLVAGFERHDIEAAVDRLISMLDDLDGDPDLEGFTLPLGCQFVPADDLASLADDEEPAPEMEGDPSWTEWSGRGGRELRRPHELVGVGGEDDEEHGDERDGNGAEDDFMQHGRDGPGCPVADSDAFSWPERVEQPSSLEIGLGGDWWDEDVEPWHVPPVTRSLPINDNDRRAA